MLKRATDPASPPEGGALVTGFRGKAMVAANRTVAVVPPAAVLPGDEALLVLFANGDPSAAAELTRRLAPRVLGVAMRVLGNQAEAEDVTQDAMIRLWKIAPEWRQGEAQVSTWLYRVTMNLCIDVKRRKRGGHVDLDAIPEPPDPAAGVVEGLQESARRDALQEALETLPERQRQAVILRHLEELTNPEIAGIMDLSVEAVESLTARGKRALAKALG